MMKTEKKAWHVSAPLITTLTAVWVVAGLLLAGWLNAQRYRVRARVEIAEPFIVQEQVISPVTARNVILPDGEVNHLAVRVREASGLLLGLTVLAISEQMQHRTFVNTNALLTSLSQHQLLPPGLTMSATENTLHSDFATLSVRYRAQPFGLEVLSVGREKTDGPPLLVRLDINSAEDAGAVLFIARQYDTKIPEAFASPAQIGALHWSVEPLRASALAPQEVEHLHAWARQYATQSR